MNQSGAGGVRGLCGLYRSSNWRPKNSSLGFVAVQWECRELENVTNKQPDNRLMSRTSEIHRKESKGLHQARVVSNEKRCSKHPNATGIPAWVDRVALLTTGVRVRAQLRSKLTMVKLCMWWAVENAVEEKFMEVLMVTYKGEVWASLFKFVSWIVRSPESYGMTCLKHAACFLPPLAFGLSMALLWSEVISSFEKLKDGYQSR